jgi:hypothetical protein
MVSLLNKYIHQPNYDILEMDLIENNISEECITREQMASMLKDDLTLDKIMD